MLQMAKTVSQKFLKTEEDLLSLFSLSSHSSQASSVTLILDLQEHYLFIPWFFFRKCCPPAHLWPFQIPPLCTFPPLQLTHYELQDLYE